MADDKVVYKIGLDAKQALTDISELRRRMIKAEEAIKDTSGNSSGSSASPQKSEVVIVNSLDPSVIEQYLTSRAGRQIIKNAVK